MATATVPMWPDPAVWADVGKFTLLVFAEDGVPTWEVRHRGASDHIRRDDLVTSGTADTFEAAKAATRFHAERQVLTLGPEVSLL